MAELDTPMSGLDPGGDVQFKPGTCTVAEIMRYPSGACSEYTHRILKPGQLEDWVEDRGEFATDTKYCGRVRWIFADTAPTGLDSEGNYISSSETLELAMTQETFASLSQRYHFSRALAAWRHRSTSGSATRQLEYCDETGALHSLTFTISIRLSGSFASTLCIHHSLASRNTSTILALRVSPHDQRLLQQALEQRRDLVGHALLAPTIVVEISLASNALFMQKIRHELSVVEKATGQHAWLQIPAAEAPAHDSELSRLGHAVKIDVSVSYRRVESVGCFLEVVRGCFEEVGERIEGGFVRTRGARDAYRQWVGDLEALLKFRLVDLKYNERRADNQITAIYGLLTQRDNMVGVSVAIESKKISEASKRDGSALKSLTVLTAVFFPATYIASLFSLPTFDNTPFWLYWVVVVPLTLIIFGSWSCWTVYRQRQIAQETIRQDIGQDVHLDPEQAFPASQSSSGSTSFLVSTMGQIRSHTKSLHYSQSATPEVIVKTSEQVLGKRG